MAQLAVVEVQWLHRQEAGVVDTDWATTGMYFLRGVHLLVPPDPPPALHPPPMADTGTAATKGIDAVILAHSQTAASPVTSDLSCHEGIREVHVVVVMTGKEAVEVESEEEEEEERQTEEGETWMIPMELWERKEKVATLVWISTTPTERPRSRAERLVSTSSFAQSPWFSPSMPWTYLMGHRRASAGRTAPLWEHARILPSLT